jgi:hypothetical protein
MRIAVFLVVGAVAAAMPASAQLSETQNREIFNQIGEKLAADAEAACMNSVLMPPAKRAEAQAGAQRTLQAYVLAARAGGRFNAAAFFIRDANRRLWVGPDGKPGDIGALSDPYAPAATAVLPEPARFVRANDLKTALGLWTLKAAAREQAGQAYAAAFRREGGRWQLMRLTLVTDEAPLPRRYCHLPGDIDRMLGNPATAGIYGAADTPPR